MYPAYDFMIIIMHNLCEYLSVLCKILFKNILKIHDKDTFENYLEDTRCKIVGLSVS